MRVAIGQMMMRRVPMERDADGFCAGLDTAAANASEERLLWPTPQLGRLDRSGVLVG
jgi:hypothetical protein